jgi:hypothetical protein
MRRDDRGEEVNRLGIYASMHLQNWTSNILVGIYSETNKNLIFVRDKP